MGYIYKSVEESWFDISMDMYKYNSRKALEDLYKTDDAIRTLKSKLRMFGNTIDINCNVTFNMLEDLNEKKRRLISFADGIHYELSYLTDNPFAVAMGNIVEKAYALNPQDIKISAPGPLGTEVTFSLESLIGADIYDADLKADFNARAAALDTDEISYDLSQALIEGDYWEGEYEKALEIAEAQNEIFPADVRTDWNSMSNSDRKKLAKKYVKELIEIYGDGNDIDYNIKFDKNLGENKFGKTADGTIRLNYDFIDNPVKNYSVDKFINTMTHEARHMYQQEVIDYPDKFNVPKSIIDGWSNNIEYLDNELENYYHTPSEADARAIAALARLYY